MSRLRPFIRHPLITELLDILRERFPGATLELNGCKVGRYETWNVDARYSGPDAADLSECLLLLSLTHGNFGFSMGPDDTQDDTNTDK